MTENEPCGLTAQQKAAAAFEAARAFRPIDEIAREYGVAPSQLRQWEQQLIRQAARLFGADKPASAGGAPALRRAGPDPASGPKPDRTPNPNPPFNPAVLQPCLLLGPDLTIVGVDALYLQAARQTREAILGRHIFDVFPHDPRTANKAGKRAAKEPGPSQSRPEAHLSQLTAGQMQVNEALIFKIFECQRVEEALQQSKNRLQQLVAHQEQIKEEERKRIAREIHDDLGQNLLALRIDISMLHARTGLGHKRLHKWAGVVLDNLDATIKSVRSIINDLRPFELELGLQAAVEWQLRAFERISGIACRLTIADAAFVQALSDEQTLAVFRILQESLSNIARHSRATEAEVTLSRSRRTFSMTVKDNGVGTNTGDRRKASSFGIVGIRERISSLGGELTIDGDGMGTVLSIAIPVHQWE